MSSVKVVFCQVVFCACSVSIVIVVFCVQCDGGFIV